MVPAIEAIALTLNLPMVQFKIVSNDESIHPLTHSSVYFSQIVAFTDFLLVKLYIKNELLTQSIPFWKRYAFNFDSEGKTTYFLHPRRAISL
jgi:hypothetical protein